MLEATETGDSSLNFEERLRNESLAKRSYKGHSGTVLGVVRRALRRCLNAVRQSMHSSRNTGVVA